MVTYSLRMVFEPGLLDEALLVLRSLKGPVRSHPGCMQTLLMSDLHNDSVITRVARWRTRPDLDRHIKSRQFRRILAVMDLAAEPPEIEFEIGTDLRGLDLIHEIIGDGSHQHLLPTNNSDIDPIRGGIDQ